MVKNVMRTPIEVDSKGVSEVVDEAIDGTKAIPIVLVTKGADGSFEYAEAGAGGAGTDGKSAYGIAVDGGFVGDETAWLLSLKGTPGTDGAKGDKGDTGSAGTPGTAGAKGDKGDTGASGADGTPGTAGKDGFGTEAQYNDIIARLEALETP